MKLKDKVIVVTGAGNGIGRELVLGLLNRGAKVAAVDMRPESLTELTKIAGDKAGMLSVYTANVTDQKAVAGLPKEIKAKQRQIDGVINNAGIIQPFVRVSELEYEAIERVMNVNFFGTLYMIKAFLPELKARPEAHIANVSSMGGFLPVPGQSVYGASKAAVKLMTEGLYAEMSGTNVHVSVIFPGAIETNITANSGVNAPNMPKSDAKAPKIKMTTPQVAAETIISGIEKNKFQIFIGGDSKMMNFLYRLSPKMATNLIAKQMQSLLPKS